MANSTLNITLNIDPLIDKAMDLYSKNKAARKYFDFLLAEEKMFIATHSGKMGVQVHLSDHALEAYYIFLGA